MSISSPKTPCGRAASCRARRCPQCRRGSKTDPGRPPGRAAYSLRRTKARSARRGAVCRQGAGCGCSRRNPPAASCIGSGPRRARRRPAAARRRGRPARPDGGIRTRGLCPRWGAAHSRGQGTLPPPRPARSGRPQTGSPRPRRASRCRAACRGPSPARHRPSPGPTPVCQIRRKPRTPERLRQSCVFVCFGEKCVEHKRTHCIKQT